MSTINLRRVVHGPDVLIQDLEGEAVLLNLTNGQYYGLDKDSYHMYKVLISSASVEAAYASLLQEYEFEPVQLRTDLEKFLAHLFENGLVTYSDDLA